MHTPVRLSAATPGAPGAVSSYTIRRVMGKEARIGLLLGAAACLLAVMVDWVIEDLNSGQ